MPLTEEEKDLIAQALQFYVQHASSQLPRESVQQLLNMAKVTLHKIDTLEEGPGRRKTGEPPPGISEEWFDKVCQACDKLSATGCTDKITVKFPGKCDPILKYERSKAGVG